MDKPPVAAVSVGEPDSEPHQPKSSTSAASAATDAGTSSGGLGPSAIDYQALYNEVQRKPCHVVYVEKVYEKEREESQEGAARPLRTKPHIIDRELQRVYDANSLEEIHDALMEATAALQQLDVFSRVDVLVTEHPEDEPDACTVMLDLDEKNWYKGSETTMEAGLGLHNAAGNAEHVALTGEFGTESSSQFALSYTQPRPLGLPLTFDGRLHQHFRNFQKTSSYTEQLRGVVLGLKSAGDRHSLQYELGWRNISDPTHHASPAVRAQTGDDLKSVLRYAFLVDRRVQPANPQSGWAFKSSMELGGLGPQVEGSAVNGRFAKHQLDFQGALPVAPGVALCLTTTAGIMLPWGSDYLRRPTCISERFHLGGASSLRGFGFKGVGPTDERRPRTTPGNGASTSSGPGTHTSRDALGGDLYTSVMAALTYQIPTPATQALKLHAHLFVNGGNNVQLAGTGRSLSEGMQRFSQTLRWSVGAGLVLPTWFGRFEVNYVALLSHQQHDRIRPGLQLGFATSAFM